MVMLLTECLDQEKDQLTDKLENLKAQADCMKPLSKSSQMPMDKDGNVVGLREVRLILDFSEDLLIASRVSRNSIVGSSVSMRQKCTRRPNTKSMFAR
jgi:hypothetical protein